MNNTENSEIIIFEDKNGEINLEVSLTGETVWLSQKQMAMLFDVKTPAINKHIKNDGELDVSTVSKMEIVQQEGKRTIKREVEFYNLDMIISVGYRVNSKRATNFRIWATRVRIGSFMFILFLAKNSYLHKSCGELKINDNALVALALMTAKSDPKQKETIISLIVNILEDKQS